MVISGIGKDLKGDFFSDSETTEFKGNLDPAVCFPAYWLLEKTISFQVGNSGELGDGRFFVVICCILEAYLFPFHKIGNSKKRRILCRDFWHFDVLRMRVVKGTPTARPLNV